MPDESRRALRPTLDSPVDIEAVRQLVEAQGAYWESEGRIPKSDWDHLGKAGCLAVEPRIRNRETLGFLETLGGLGYAGARSAIAVNTVMAKAYLADSNLLSRSSVLASVACGSRVLGLALTEPGSGSLLEVQTSAVRNGSRFLLNGRKVNIANGTVSDYLIVLARTSEARRGSSLSGCTLFFVDKRNHPDRLGVEKAELTCWRSADVCDLTFHDFEISEESVIGRVDGAMLPLMRGLEVERFFASVLALGGAAYTLELIDKRVRSNDPDQIPLRRYQVVRHAYVDLKARHKAIRARLSEICGTLSENEAEPQDVLETKVLSTELESETADLLRSISGARAYEAGTDIERVVRDAYTSSITAGPNDLLRDLIYAP